MSVLDSGLRDGAERDRLVRLAGVLYLLTLPTTGAWFGISGSLLQGDTATIEALRAGRGLFELAILLGTLGNVIHLVLAVVLYRVLKPFGPIAAALALILLAASVPLSFAAIARELDLLALLDAASALSAVGAAPEAQFTLLAHSYISLFNTQTVFWGLWLLPLGWLLLQSRLVPRVLAVLVLFGGPFYVVSFIGTVLDPGYASSLFGRIVGFSTGLPELIGEVGIALWLTLRGTRHAQPLPPEPSR